MRNKFIFSGVILLIVAFIIYGRSIYLPVKNKIMGNESVESVVSKISNTAYERLKACLETAGILGFPDKLILVGLKEEQLLQIYADSNGGIKLVKQYPFTAMSGGLGPKLQRGDRQIPEGIYGIEYLNANSSYYLSMKITYPNAFDKSKSSYANIKDMGDNIFIHGKDVTIGCIPIGDEAIEEVFMLVEKAGIEDVKVIISPRDFRINSEYPIVEEIEWEDELYDLIEKELFVLPLQN